MKSLMSKTLVFLFAIILSTSLFAHSGSASSNVKKHTPTAKTMVKKGKDYRHCRYVKKCKKNSKNKKICKRVKTCKKIMKPATKKVKK